MSALKERVGEYISTMSDEKLAILEPLLKRLSEENPGEDPQWEYPYVCEYGYLHNPNAETIAAMEETEQIIANPSKYKSFSSVADLMADLESEDDSID